MGQPLPTISYLFIVCSCVIGLTSCTVDEQSASTTRSGASGSQTKIETMSFAERMEQAQEEREKKSAAAAKEREKMAALKKKEDEAKARELAAKKKKDEAEKKALAAKKAREEAAEKKAREQELAKRKAEEEKKREARLAARQKAEEERESRRREQEVAAAAERSGGGGFFNQLTVTTPTKYKSKGHKIYVNRAALAGLNPSNAKIEIDLSDQKARIYKSNGGNKQLVIETQVSTGKSGHGTPTGSYRISEKKVEKRSTLYGSWVNSSGSTVRSSGEAWSRPSGASRFVGAEMPYWMRVNGGIGMHVGYVPDYPASHGCIRVPSSVQPLIYSKVGVGTQVTIRS